MGETAHDFLCLCPFHGNTNTPSFSVSKTNGSFICFNHSCNQTGSLVVLVRRVSGKGEFAARRIILKAKSGMSSNLEAIKKLQAVEMPTFSQAKIDEMRAALWENYDAVSYMTEVRGFEEETLTYFEIGYSTAKNIIAVPMHDAKGTPIGVIGRSPSSENKQFKNSIGLPTSKTLFNIHRAKKAGSSVTVVEASFDVMRNHQAGFPCTVGTLSGHISPYHLEQLDRHFDTINIMTDMDKHQIYKDCAKCAKLGHKFCKGHNPGRDLGETIAKQLSHKKIFWNMYSDEEVFPNGNKDTGDCTDDEIRLCHKNKVSNFEYKALGIY